MEIESKEQFAMVAGDALYRLHDSERLLRAFESYAIGTLDTKPKHSLVEKLDQLILEEMGLIDESGVTEEGGKIFRGLRKDYQGKKSPANIPVNPLLGKGVGWVY